MQHLARSSFQPSRFAMASNETDDGALSAALEEAAQLVRSGAWAETRLACANLIQLHQPRLAQSPHQLTEAVAILAMARGFRTLSRLLEATTRQRLRFAVSDCASVAAGPGGWAQVTVPAAVLDDPVAAQRWAEHLIGPTGQPSGGTQSTREACLT